MSASAATETSIEADVVSTLSLGSRSSSALSLAANLRMTTATTPTGPSAFLRRDSRGGSGGSAGVGEPGGSQVVDIALLVWQRLEARRDGRARSRARPHRREDAAARDRFAGLRDGHPGRRRARQVGHEREADAGGDELVGGREVVREVRDARLEARAAADVQDDRVAEAALAAGPPRRAPPAPRAGSGPRAGACAPARHRPSGARRGTPAPARGPARRA